MMPNLPPDGFADEPGAGGPPDGFADESPQVPQSSTLHNAGSDLKDIAMGGLSMPKALLMDAPIQNAKDIYQTGKGMMNGQPFSQTPVANDLRAPLGMAKDALQTGSEYLRHPVQSFQEHPIKMPLNVLGAAGAAGEGYGAAKSMLAPVAKSVADVAEQASGLTYKTPGVLRKTFERPSKLFDPGVEKARELYGQTEGSVNSDLSGISNHQDFVDKAMEMQKAGTLTPTDALEARKSLDKIKKNVPGSYFRKTRDALDTIAKQDYAIADKAYGRGVEADNMRKLFGINKGGTPSLVKMGVGTVLKGAIPAFSPLFQSSAAAGLGAADKAATAFSKSGVSPFAAATSQSGKKFNQPLQENQKQDASGSDGNVAQPKIIDEATARQFLKQANGDKVKARQLAKEAGFIVQ